MPGRRRPIRVLVGLEQCIGFDRRAFAGIMHMAQAYDGLVIDFPWNYSSLGAAIAGERPDGIITAAVERDMPFLISTGLPCVNVANCVIAQNKIPVVGNDEQVIGEMVADFYLSQDFDCFAYIDDYHNPYFADRKLSFVRSIKSAGFECEIMPKITNSERSKDGALPHIGRFLRRFKKPVAVMCPFDANAREVVQAAKMAGIRIPEQVSVVGVDDDEQVCLSVVPSISSVSTAARKIGQTALQLLLAILDGGKPPSKPIFCPPTGLVQRGSTGEKAIVDDDVAAALQYIRSHLSDRLTVETVAQMTSTSRRTLERRFVQLLGRTPQQELRRLRIERAKTLLAETDLELPEVAIRSGLGHHSRLATVLKMETGMSPRQFREQHLRKSRDE